jgi:hypothetical protein
LSSKTVPDEYQMTTSRLPAVAGIPEPDAVAAARDGQGLAHHGRALHETAVRLDREDPEEHVLQAAIHDADPRGLDADARVLGGVPVAAPADEEAPHLGVRGLDAQDGAGPAAVEHRAGPGQDPQRPIDHDVLAIDAGGHHDLVARGGRLHGGGDRASRRHGQGGCGRGRRNGQEHEGRGAQRRDRPPPAERQGDGEDEPQAEPGHDQREVEAARGLGPHLELAHRVLAEQQRVHGRERGAQRRLEVAVVHGAAHPESEVRHEEGGHQEGGGDGQQAPAPPPQPRRQRHAEARPEQPERGHHPLEACDALQ